MLVQFQPWRTCSIACGNSNDVKASKRKRKDSGPASESSLKISFIEEPLNSLELADKSQHKQPKSPNKKKIPPLICVTRPHFVSILKKATKNDNELDETPVWNVPPGPAHAFLSSSVKCIPAVISCKGEWTAALQNSNTTVSIRMIKEDLDGSIHSVDLPKGTHATSLFILESDTSILCGTLNNGSLFFFSSQSLDDLKSDSECSKLNFCIVEASDASDSDPNERPKSTKKRGRRSKLKKNQDETIQTKREEAFGTMIWLSSKDTYHNVAVVSVESEAHQLIVRHYSIPSGQDLLDQRCTRSFKVKLPSQVQKVVSCTTLDSKTGTFALLCETGHQGKERLHQMFTLNVTTSELDTEASASISMDMDVDDSNSSITMGTLTKHHVALASTNLGLQIWDLRYEGGVMVYHCPDVKQFFPSSLAGKLELQLLGSNPTSHSLALGMISETELHIAFSKLDLGSAGDNFTMADTFKSVLKSSEIIYDSTEPSKQPFISLEDIWCKKDLIQLPAQVQNTSIYLDEQIQKLNDFVNKSSEVSDEWQGIFEESVQGFMALGLHDKHDVVKEVDKDEEDSSSSSPVSPADLVQQTATDKKPRKDLSSNKKLKNGINKEVVEVIQIPDDNETSNLVNGHDSLSKHKNSRAYVTPTKQSPRKHDWIVEKKSSPMREGFQIIPHEFFMCAAKSSIRIMHKHYLEKNNKTVKRTRKSSRQAAKVLTFCIQHGNISLRDLDHFLGLLTNHQCTSFVDFLCKSSQEFRCVSLISLLKYCNEVSEKHLVQIAYHVLCTMPVNNVTEFFTKNHAQVSKADSFDLDEYLSNWSEELKLENCELGQLLHCASVLRLLENDEKKSECNANLVRQSSIFWCGMLAKKCDKSMNPNLLRSAIVDVAQVAQGGAGSHVIAVMALCFASYISAVSNGKLVRPVQKDSKMPRPEAIATQLSLRRAIEWMEALADCRQLKQAVTSKNDTKDARSNDEVAWILVKENMKSILAQVQNLVDAESLISLTVRDFYVVAKRKRDDLIEHEGVVSTLQKAKRYMQDTRLPSYRLESATWWP